MVRISFIILIVLVFCILSCDFFMASAFPDYLPSVRRVENLDTYFSNSSKYNYDLFVLSDGPPPGGNDYVFVLYKPATGTRRVIVLDDELHVRSDYEHINLGSLHTQYSGGPVLAAIGSRRMSLDGTYTWDINDINAELISERDNIIIYNNNRASFYSVSIINNEYCNWYEYPAALAGGAGPSQFQIDDLGENFTIEAVGYAINNENPPNTADDEVIFFIRRERDNEGIAIVIPAADFANIPAGNQPVLPMAPYYIHFFGAIKPGSVHIFRWGRVVVFERMDGEVELIEYDPTFRFMHRNETNGKQFKNKIVAYSNVYPEYYVFDPETKEIFQCHVWWEK